MFTVICSSNRVPYYLSTLGSFGALHATRATGCHVTIVTSSLSWGLCAASRLTGKDGKSIAPCAEHICCPGCPVDWSRFLAHCMLPSAQCRFVLAAWYWDILDLSDLLLGVLSIGPNLFQLDPVCTPFHFCNASSLAAGVFHSVQILSNIRKSSVLCKSWD